MASCFDNGVPEARNAKNLYTGMKHTHFVPTWSPAGHEGKSDRVKKFHKQQQQKKTENWARINLDSAEMEHIQQTSRLLNAGKIFTFLLHHATFSHLIFDDNLDDTSPANCLPGHVGNKRRTRLDYQPPFGK